MCGDHCDVRVTVLIPPPSWRAKSESVENDKKPQNEDPEYAISLR